LEQCEPIARISQTPYARHSEARGVRRHHGWTTVIAGVPFSPGGELCLDETFTREGAFKTGPRVDEEAWRHPLAA